MINIRTYEDMEVKVNWATPNPGKEIREALTNTMYDITLFPNTGGTVSKEMIDFLFKAEHSSVMEHAVISFTVKGASRSWLAQITRHRMASMTSSSQHYQDYKDYPYIVHRDLVHYWTVNGAIEDLNDRYVRLLDNRIPKEEARQILPNAAAVNFKWTINARSLYNFMRLRMCLRNVEEMRIFCDKVFLLVQEWWPEYTRVLGPPCFVDGECNQGFMTCGKEFKHVKDA